MADFLSKSALISGVFAAVLGRMAVDALGFWVAEVGRLEGFGMF
jgi:hypothetical protein